MKKSEVKNGAVLKSADGNVWFKMDDVLFKVTEDGVKGGWMPWNAYDNDMKYQNPDYNIIAVNNNVDNDFGLPVRAINSFLTKTDEGEYVEIQNDDKIAKSLTPNVMGVLEMLYKNTPYVYIVKDFDNSVWAYAEKPEKGKHEFIRKLSDHVPALYLNAIFIGKEIQDFFDVLNRDEVYKIESFLMIWDELLEGKKTT